MGGADKDVAAGDGFDVGADFIAQNAGEAEVGYGDNSRAGIALFDDQRPDFELASFAFGGGGHSGAAGDGEEGVGGDVSDADSGAELCVGGDGEENYSQCYQGYCDVFHMEPLLVAGTVLLCDDVSKCGQY